MSSSAFGVESVPDSGHSNQYVVISHCCFNLHFSDGMAVESLFISIFAIVYLLW